MKLYRKGLEIYNPSMRDIYDRRRKVAKAVFSYTSEHGEEHRRGFTDKPHTPETKFWSTAPEEINI